MNTIDRPLDSFSWLRTRGVTQAELDQLNPCVPGEFSLIGELYVNSASPEVVYHGGAEATLPLVGGRWYFVPQSILEQHPALRQDTKPVAAAPRLIGY
ncbi:MAG: hypothetical protein ACRDFS_04735 [Chloroflexota bacterium]